MRKCIISSSRKSRGRAAWRVGRVETPQCHKELCVLCILSCNPPSGLMVTCLQPFQAPHPDTATSREESGHFFLWLFLRSEKIFPKLCSGNEQMSPHISLATLAIRDLFALIISFDKKEKPPEYTIPKPITGEGEWDYPETNEAHLWSWDESPFPHLWSWNRSLISGGYKGMAIF